MTRTPVAKKAVAKKAVAKKAAPVRKKAVAKKAVAKKAVAKKAVAKKAVAKKAAPVRKKAVAKKAAPVRKKAVAKKAAPVRKKAVAKKAAPVRKKAVAKKAAPIRKKAVAEKIAPVIPAPLNLDKIEFRSPTIVEPLLQTEPKLPEFLKDVTSEAKKELIATQRYSKKRSGKLFVVGLASAVLLLGVAVYAVSNNSASDITSGSKKVADVVSDESNVIDLLEEEKALMPTPSPSSTKSPSNTKPAKSNIELFAPKDFSSNLVDLEISFEWTTPANSSSVIGYELSARKSGSDEWIVISSVTPQQQVITIELSTLDSSSEYRIASILENGKSAFNQTVLTHPGAVD